ncbi:Hypothetical protein, putative [Bodo saltans]|uniref:EF-hand domain-containing protein n=1 Tax=Bodo saltans TaxID=75058 RepID=A0A0S4JTJ0_BODSA|nr:Hypothetical protein, putative [Bodo saltans]|eukprot:CUG92729.1 Hypothetical protein, putative [Bodo saltans]
MLFYACAEVLPGTKLNFALSFSAVPLLESLYSTSTALFQKARHELCQQKEYGNSLNASRVTPFIVDEAVIYNPRTTSWQLLASEEQLFPLCQVYFFQSPTVSTTLGIQDSVGQMPDPVKPQDFFSEFIASPKTTTKSASLCDDESETRFSFSIPEVPTVRSFRATERSVLPSSPPRNRRPSPPRGGSTSRLKGATVAAPKLPSEVTSELFSLLDEDSDGVVTLFQLRDAMARAGIDTSPATVGKTFAFGDRAVSESVFSNFVHRYWSLCVELLEKCRHSSGNPDKVAWETQLAELESQENELLAKLQSLRKVKKVLQEALAQNSVTDTNKKHVV